jgi:hypothetical protein
VDADRFDSLVKALSLSAVRRGMVAGLLGGGLASLLAVAESEGRRHRGQHNELSAEKRKKHKKKRKKRKKKRNPGDEAPPCTEDSCPLPPGCSQPAFDDCAAALVEALQADVEACRPDCEGGDGPACRACLKPILDAHLTIAEECVVESCSSSASRIAGPARAKAQAGEAGARLWWERQCGKPCCYHDLRGCTEDSGHAFIDCIVAASACQYVPGSCTPSYLFCLSRFAYDRARCDARFGCTTGSDTCGEGDICCQRGFKPCHGGCCRNDADCCDGGMCCAAGTHCCPEEGCCDCSPGAHSCPGGGCCRDGDTCCFRESSQMLFCCPPGAQCMQTGIPCCSNC